MLSYNFDLICVLLSHVHQQHCNSLPSSHLPLSCAHLSADQEKELWMRADSLGHLLSLLPVSGEGWGEMNCTISYQVKKDVVSRIDEWEGGQGGVGLILRSNWG